MKQLRLLLAAFLALALTSTGFAQVGARNRLAPNTVFQGINNEVPLGSTLKLNGAVVLGAGGTFDATLGTYTPSGNITILTSKTLTINSGGTLTVSGVFGGTPASGTLNLGALTLTIGNTSIPSSKTLTVASGGAITGASGSTITVSGTLTGTPTGGTLDLSAVTVVGGKASIGGSTAAAGSSTTDATVLPAATARVYPTTAADGTKGVRIHASDEVTGRTLFIGNGVSNQTIKVYPPTGSTINGASADVAFVSASGKGVILICLNSGSHTWFAW